MTAPAVLAPPSRRVHVGQGEHQVTDDPSVLLTTILGSCVSMCLRDPVAGVGGMNHFLLPEGQGGGTDAGRRYGAYAMEVLINDCLKAGGRRDRLEAKLFGGGRMFDALRDVGQANADFAERFLRDEGIAHVGGSLRGAGGRRVQYWPVSGRAMQRPVADAMAVAPEVIRPAPVADAGALELF
ncbi:chemotaxis protein CheD [Brevundimonas alba]|uniref:Probable chemoreceptor glutamine deamidase CheD n=1 Tax=Brevundimonas alba TaxID=74314 RepID=A0A7X6BMB3_9CAUL|nr:chemotaxis protein CheD [Brevundimonas alba]NJC39814.1 chemotaxis protein CheD [Brevundimonas alba]